MNRIILILLSMLLVACNNHSTNNKLQTFEVNKVTFHDVLHFSGTVQPLHENTLTSPVDGVLEQMHYQFGSHVKKGDIIFTVNSAALQKQYNDALTEYLKTKDNYSIAKTKFNGTDDLWKAGLVAKNNYLSEKSNLNTIHVSLMQAWHNLSIILEKTGDLSANDLTKLNLAEFSKVQEALGKEHHLIQFRAPINGVVLYPPLSSGDTKTNHLSTGSTIKIGQALALIGDLSGIRVEIDIPEVDIDKITPGLAAVIRGVAFNQQELQGKLTNITSQASVSGSGTLPSFQATVEVQSLTQKQQDWIKAGMSATVELSIHRAEQLMIPIAAVHLTHGESMVNIRMPDGKIKEQKVVTGSSKASQVTILEGLKTGDVIVYE